MRTPSDELERLAVAAFRDVLAPLKLRPHRTERADLRVTSQNGATALVDLHAAATPTTAQVTELVRSAPPDRAHVLVADRIVEPVRELLRASGWGWLDRRGHLRIAAPGLLIETTTAPRSRPPSRGRPDPIAGRSGITVALSLLMHPTEALHVRGLARASRLSPSVITDARKRLADAALLQRDGRPLIPELFWATTDAWASHVRRFPISRAPESVVGAADDLASPGTALGGAAGAAAWGAPIVRGGTSTLDLYLPGQADVDACLRELGPADAPAGPPARIAAAPTLLVVAPRFPDPSGGWPLVHPVVAALDLALDPARGHEVLETWDGPEGFARVW
ncbi:MAG: hypothetical protein HYU28_12625 [Actinobacteria bacterium]|nr:hypothetical protein [Actinomycetota bacterium]